jgi:hypothetical protein
MLVIANLNVFVIQAPVVDALSTNEPFIASHNFFESVFSSDLASVFESGIYDIVRA